MTNNGPKNFRNMKFPVPREGTTTAVYALLPPPPPLKTISLSESDRRASQLKEMKKFVNAQKCPVCGAQLDGSVGFDKATLFCRANEKEYEVAFKYGISLPIWSKSVLYTTYFAFEVINRLITEELYENVIFKIDLSLNQRYQQLEKKELLKYEGENLSFKGNLTEEQLLHKIKLYTLFS